MSSSPLIAYCRSVLGTHGIDRALQIVPRKYSGGCLSARSNVHIVALFWDLMTPSCSDSSSRAGRLKSTRFRTLPSLTKILILVTKPNVLDGAGEGRSGCML